MTGTDKQIAAVKEVWPNINWDRFEDIDRMLNMDLWYGTAHEYFGGDSPAETLEHYEWEGFEKAVKDMEEVLADLPSEAWWDGDAEWISTTNPDDDDYNWRYTCRMCDESLRVEFVKFDEPQKGMYGKHIYLDDEDKTECKSVEGDHTPSDEPYWVGGYEWEDIDPRKIVMFDETYKQVF